MMYLDGQGKETLAVSFKEFAHGEDRQQELALIEHIDVEGSEF